VNHNTRDKDAASPDANLFNLIVFDDSARRLDEARRGGSGAREIFLNVSIDAASPRFVTKILEQQSNLVRIKGVWLARPGVTSAPNHKPADPASANDGGPIGSLEIVGGASQANKTGMYALEKADIFNLLCIPPFAPDTIDNDIGSTWSPAAKFCKDRRAMLIVDAPADWTLDSASANYPPKKLSAFSAIERSYAAIYFPRIRLPDPLQDNNLNDFAPCGVVAGVFSRTDAERGVWKAPAGIEAGLRGVLGLSINSKPESITDKENGDLNPLGINCLRSFPNIGNVVWGARTLEGADSLASQWKYVPVRRLALYIEESLFRGTQWVVFEPNDEPLWAQIRLNIGAFMHGLFRQGAFQGTTPRDAYLVKCDKETTTQDDVNHGVVNIVVGFAPLKPAEFVVIKIQQLAGQLET
jgi:phage tail sheath protein FI